MRKKSIKTGSLHSKGRRKRVLRAVLSMQLCIVLAFTLSACGSSGGRSKTSKAEFNKNMAKAYEKVLSNAEEGDYDFSNPDFEYYSMTPITDGSTSMQYALQDIDGDKHPELFVRQPQTTTEEPTIQWNTIIFTYKGGKKAKKLDGTITLPTATQHVPQTADTSLYATKSGKGAYKRIYNASVPGDPSDPDKSNTKRLWSIAVDGDEVVETLMDGTDKPEDMGEKIEFTDISDLSPLRSLAGEKKKGTANKSEQDSSAKKKYDKAVAACGQDVWEGTLKVLSDREVAQLQVDYGEITQADYDSLTSQFTPTQNVILILNKKTDVTAKSGDGPGTYSDKQQILKLEGDDAGWKAYDGRHIAVKVPPADAAVFPTDTSLPIRGVRASISAADYFVAAY